MAGVFTLDCLPGVPGPGQRAVLLTARVDLDLATEAGALSEIRRVTAEPVDAALLDLSYAFVGVTVVRCLRELAAPARPVAVVGAPRWLVELAPRLDLPALPYLRTVSEAADRLRAAGLPRQDGHLLRDGHHDGQPHHDGHPHGEARHRPSWLRPPASQP
jgi:hypothetical protein